MNVEEIEARFQRVERSHIESAERLDRIEAIVHSNARAIAANSEVIATNSEESRRLQASLNEQIADVVRMLGSYAAQAEQDRIALTASVQALINTLQERFRDNRHRED